MASTLLMKENGFSIETNWFVLHCLVQGSSESQLSECKQMYMYFMRLMSTSCKIETNTLWPSAVKMVNYLCQSCNGGGWSGAVGSRRKEQQHAVKRAQMVVPSTATIICDCIKFTAAHPIHKGIPSSECRAEMLRIQSLIELISGQTM